MNAEEKNKNQSRCAPKNENAKNFSTIARRGALGAHVSEKKYAIGVVRSVVAEEAEKAGLTVAEMMIPCRRPKHVGARNRAMFRLFEMGMSASAIGRLLKRHPSTVLYALGRLNK